MCGSKHSGTWLPQASRSRQQQPPCHVSIRRLPPSIVCVELSCIRDWLPQPLSQLTGLQRLHVRRGLVSDGVLLTEYEALQHLTGGHSGAVFAACWAGWEGRRRATWWRYVLVPVRCMQCQTRLRWCLRPQLATPIIPRSAGLTSLALEHQEEEAWLLPPELLLLTGLRHLSFAGNDCSRECRQQWGDE